VEASAFAAFSGKGIAVRPQRAIGQLPLQGNGIGRRVLREGELCAKTFRTSAESGCETQS